jgi:hypothetical protein
MSNRNGAPERADGEYFSGGGAAWMVIILLGLLFLACVATGVISLGP